MPFRRSNMKASRILWKHAVCAEVDMKEVGQDPRASRQSLLGQRLRPEDTWSAWKRASQHTGTEGVQTRCRRATMMQLQQPLSGCGIASGASFRISHQSSVDLLRSAPGALRIQPTHDDRVAKKSAQGRDRRILLTKCEASIRICTVSLCS